MVIHYRAATKSKQTSSPSTYQLIYIPEQSQWDQSRASWTGAEPVGPAESQSRAGAEPEQSQSRAGAEPEQSRSRAGADFGVDFIPNSASKAYSL